MAGRRIKHDIITLNQQGVSGAEIARRMACTRSYVSQVISSSGFLMPTQAGKPVERKPRVPSKDCQRPDARKGFATCGEPKLKTACGETLGVCAYHYATTKPLGGTKL